MHLILQARNLKPIRFNFYFKKAPFTCKAFLKALPFNARAVQARFAGEEIWLPKGSRISISQENATINLKLGEIGFAPINCNNEVAGSIAIVYGEAKLSDCVNVFAKVLKNDKTSLKKLGEKVWLEGAQSLTFKLGE